MPGLHCHWHGAKYCRHGAEGCGLQGCVLLQQSKAQQVVHWWAPHKANNKPVNAVPFDQCVASPLAAVAVYAMFCFERSTVFMMQIPLTLARGRILLGGGRELGNKSNGRALISHVCCTRCTDPRIRIIFEVDDKDLWRCRASMKLNRMFLIAIRIKFDRKVSTAE
jgi:hypothetical protein